MTNNDIQDNTQKTTYQVPRTPLKTWDVNNTQKTTYQVTRTPLKTWDVNNTQKTTYQVTRTPLKTRDVNSGASGRVKSYYQHNIFIIGYLPMIGYRAKYNPIYMCTIK